MQKYLLFSYYAPIAAFGQIAVGEVRNSWSIPGKSAILGLIACGLGLARDDTEGQSALTKNYGYAVRTDAAGHSLSDYHTVQTISRANTKKHQVTTRRDVLTNDKQINTKISRRSYVCDSLFTVCIWESVTNEVKWPLQTISDALKHPHYQPYAGRKSCPFALPCDPKIISAKSLEDAFGSRKPWPEKIKLNRFEQKSEARKYFFRGKEKNWGRQIAYDAGRESKDLVPTFTHQRCDVSTDRSRWQFAWREEKIATLPESENSQ